MDNSMIGYGAMQLAGAGAWGPPPSWSDAVGLLRTAYLWGVRLFDTAWYYGPHVTHRLLAEALHPYPEDVVLVTKCGNSRGPNRSWKPALEPTQLISACEADLRLLRLDSLPLALLRWSPHEDDMHAFGEAVDAMVGLMRVGSIQRIGLSNVRIRHLEYARSVTTVSAVSNSFSLTNQRDSEVLDRCSAIGLAYLPYYPLLGGDVLRRPLIEQVAKDLGATGAQVALAWLRHRSPVITPIPGTRNRLHLRENIDAWRLQLSEGHLRTLEHLRVDRSG